MIQLIEQLKEEIEKKAELYQKENYNDDLEYSRGAYKAGAHSMLALIEKLIEQRDENIRANAYDPAREAELFEKLADEWTEDANTELIQLLKGGA